MHLTPREFDKLLIYMLADVALKRKGKGSSSTTPRRSPSSRLRPWMVPARARRSKT